ncbi:fungal-specific transcription factor domain-containing protein [Cladorrhinum sp. PSN259]|nr:fungal-specific transcription factor domain-containing protein [Cladorrhinum sp. PSN259]
MSSSSKVRSFVGCWTCRLRRKKCDEGRPACQGCAALDIDCIYSDTKPEWMDGGDKQKEKGEWLKREVKRRANLRRERRHMQGLEVKLESLGVDGDEDGQGIITTAHLSEPSAHTPESSTDATATAAFSPDESSAGESIMSSAGHYVDSPVTQPSPAAGIDSNIAGPPEIAGPGIPLEERDAHSTMFYLDYVFPFLFPFYRPSFLDMGRGWLLVLLTKNKALFHIAMTMSGYFYGVILSSSQETIEDHRTCTGRNLAILHSQQQIALQCLQDEIREVVNKGVKGHLAEAGRVMASIVQLLTSEVAVANYGNWTMHLEAATELFDEMMKHHGTTGNGHSCFMMLLYQLGSTPFSWTPKYHPWGSDQAILRFFTAQLVLFDTIASVTLEQAPRLQHWHQHLLSHTVDEETMKHMPKGDKEHTMPHINLEEFCGIQNWLITSIAEISTLSNWKKEMKKYGSLSISELVRRAQVIEQHILHNIASLEQEPPPPSPSAATATVGGCPPKPFQHHASNTPSSQGIHSTILNTRIWAQSTLTYLKVVVSGWQPASPEIMCSVATTIDLLLRLPSPECLRTVIWPFTVAGCLVTSPEQEQVLRGMVTAMGPLQALGTVREGMAILENAWANRGQIDECGGEWDLAVWFRCLGRPALLI